MLKKLQESDIKLLNILREVVNCGGFADIEYTELSVVRSYSFSTPAQAGDSLNFHVRLVPGAFSVVGYLVVIELGPP